MEGKLNQKTNDNSKTIKETNIPIIGKYPGWMVWLDIQKLYRNWFNIQIKKAYIWMLTIFDKLISEEAERSSISIGEKNSPTTTANTIVEPVYVPNISQTWPLST